MEKPKEPTRWSCGATLGGSQLRQPEQSKCHKKSILTTETLGKVWYDDIILEDYEWNSSHKSMWLNVPYKVDLLFLNHYYNIINIVNIYIYKQ